MDWQPPLPRPWWEALISLGSRPSNAFTRSLAKLRVLNQRMYCAGLPWLIWTSFLSLTALHVYANIRAVRALTLTSLNPSRLQLLVDAFYLQVVAFYPQVVATRLTVAYFCLLRLALAMSGNVCE